MPKLCTGSSGGDPKRRGQGRGGGGGGKKGRTSGGGGSNNAPAQPSANPSPNKSPAATKQMKEIQASERALLEADQMLENLANEDAIMTVKPKALGTLCDRLQNRLTPALCAIYCQGYDASDSSAAATPGMTCLEKLRKKQRVLASVKDHLGRCIQVANIVD